MRVALGGLAVDESESVSRRLFMHPAHRTIGVALGSIGVESAAAPPLWIVAGHAGAVLQAEFARLTNNAAAWTC